MKELVLDVVGALAWVVWVAAAVVAVGCGYFLWLIVSPLLKRPR